jgi:hypothetical protein
MPTLAQAQMLARVKVVHSHLAAAAACSLNLLVKLAHAGCCGDGGPG